MFPGIKFTEKELLDRVNSTGESDIEHALTAHNVSFNDFLSLISPLAQKYIPQMRETASRIRKSHFGKVVRLYAPIYFSNYCVNNCVYCGFRHSNKFDRRRLTLDEILAEAHVLKSWGMDSVLLIAGEDPKTVTPEFLSQVVPEVKKLFSYISVELHPQTEADYRKLFELGVHGLTLYQETYDRELYAKLHPSGPKRNYDGRVSAPEAAARAGFYNIGIGALLGLYNWRSEAISMYAHTLAIRKQNWRVRNQFSFPRITPMEGGFEVPNPVSIEDLEQVMLAFRIAFPESDMFVSTREPHEFRMKAVRTCATHISAGSKVSPGGYVESVQHKKEDVGQFTVVDDHSVPHVMSSLRAIGMEPVFKDWDATFGERAI